ncbi:MAG: NADH-quinone oxidoreductase subunit C [Candidatus Bathyarchaeia archaeon]
MNPSRPRRLFIRVKAEDYKEAVRKLVEEKGIIHISTITGVDTGKEIEILTHLFGRGVELTVATAVSREEPRIESITDILPGATFYEREVYDLLGVRFEGHPNLKRVLLPDEWPEGVYPLRKDYKPQKGSGEG